MQAWNCFWTLHLQACSMIGFSGNDDAEPRWLNPILRGDKQQTQVNFKGEDLPVYILEKQIL